MKEEKYSEIIHDALNFLDDEMIEEVDRLRGGVSVESVSTQASMQEEIKDFSQKKAKDAVDGVYKKTAPWRKWAALAASICLLVVVGNAWEIQPDGGGNTGNSNEINDEQIEGNPEDQAGMLGMAPDSVTDGENYGVLDQDGSQEELGEPQISEMKPSNSFLKLQNYKEVYFSDAKDAIPSDDGMVMLSEEVYEVLDKFIDSTQRGTVCPVDSIAWTEAMEKAEGHLFFELKDGTNVHLVLLGQGMVASYDTKTAWVQMDKRVYRIFVEMLKEES